VLIWWLTNSDALSQRAASAISGDESDVHVSAASVWEIEIKRAIGKLEAPTDVTDQIRKQQFRPLGISIDHAATAGALPRLHGDPFDRMLVAQAQLEGLTVVTADARIERYAVHTLAAAA
jgi:PIN domain nuclease of toxin-antitoxin system